jgi:perosamine synthetase
MKKIQYVAPSISELEAEYVNDAVRNGWGPNCYEYIHRFEHEFARFHNVSFAHATSSCTGALHLGLAAAGIGAGDEVILAETNWVATLAPIVHLGAKPILVDIDPLSWCIDPRQVERAISSKTKAVIATHLYGNLCEIDALREICDRNQIILIEDAAEAFGSRYKNKLAGSFGKFSTFSFHGTKTITTGEGGMLLTNDGALIERVRTLNNHGRSQQQTKQFWPDMLGYKFKMSNIQAALGLAQLHRAQELINRKIETFNSYSERLSQSFKMNQATCSVFKPSYWMPTIVTDSAEQKERILQALVGRNIDARTFFWPLSAIFPELTSLGGVRASEIASRALNLPSPYDISADDIERVVKAVFLMD